MLVVRLPIAHRTAVLLLLVFLMLVPTGRAWGQPAPLPQPPPFSPEEVDAMALHLYHGSPSRALSTPAVCDAECSERLQAERQTYMAVPTAQAMQRELALRRELLEAREKSKLWPPKTKWGKITLGSTVFTIGFELGTLAQKKWFGAEAPPSAQGRAGDIVSAKLVSPGQVLASGAGETTGPWQVTAPTLGWVGLNAQGSMVGTMVYDSHPGRLWPPPSCEPYSEAGLTYAGWGILKGAPDDFTFDCGTSWAHYEVPSSR